MAILRRVLSLALFVVLALVLFGGGWLVGRLGIGSVVAPSSLTEAGTQFSEHAKRDHGWHVHCCGSRESDAKPRPLRDFECREGRGRLVAVQRQDGLLRLGRVGSDPDCRADAICRGYAGHHDDRHEPARNRDVHGAGVLLRRSVRRHVATRPRGRPHVRSDRKAGQRRSVEQRKTGGPEPSRFLPPAAFRFGAKEGGSHTAPFRTRTGTRTASCAADRRYCCWPSAFRSWRWPRWSYTTRSSCG